MVFLCAERLYRWPGVIFCTSRATRATDWEEYVCVCVCVRLDRLLAPCLEGGIAFPRCLMRYWDPRRSQRSIPCATGANGYRGATRWANGAGRPPCKAYVRSSQLSCTQPWQPDCEICFIKDFWQWKILRHAVSHHSMAYVDFHVMWDCCLFLFALVKFLPFALAQLNNDSAVTKICQISGVLQDLQCI